MSTLHDRLSREQLAWKPEPGDLVVGIVLDVTWRDGGYGDYPVVAIETDDGVEYAIHGFHTTLRNELGALDLHPGDQLGIKYLGKQTAASGNAYHSYRVVAEKAARPVEEPAVTVADTSTAGPTEFPLGDDEPF